MKKVIRFLSRLHKLHLGPTRLAFLAILATGLSSGSTSAAQAYPVHGSLRQATPAGDASLPAQQAVPAVPLTAAVAPGGNFAASVPRGWSIASSQQGDSFVITPIGQTQPSAYFMVVNVSDLRFRASIAACSRGFRPFGNLLTQCTIPSVRTQLVDSSHAWAPAQALGVILQEMQANGSGQFGAPSFISVSSAPSSAQAFYRVTGTTPRGPIEYWGIVTVLYLPNPMLDPQAVTSLAVIAGCSSSPDTAVSFRRTCAGMIDSYRPSPNWVGRLTAEMVNNYQQEGQILLQMGYNALHGFQARERMINFFGQSMQNIQQQTFQAIQSRSYLNGQEWIATFGGNTLMKNPDTGELISVPFGYQSYGLDDRGLTPTVLAGPDERPGASIGSAVSQKTLVSPP
jgi:hypothetical protein